MTWFERRDGIALAGPSAPMFDYLRRLYPILRGIDGDFRAMLSDVAFVGAAGDPHALLLDILGLHSGSVEWAQRYAESLQTLFNRLNLLGLGGFAMILLTIIERVAARQKLTALGYAGDKDPPILDLSFSGRHNALTGGVVDDVPLSESAPIRSYTDGGDNYLRWLIDAANISLDALYAQEGFTDDIQPTAILYLLLRHALQLGYHDVSIRLFETAGIYTPEQVLAARSDDPFLHIRDNQLDSESRYFPLYTTAAGDHREPRPAGARVHRGQHRDLRVRLLPARAAEGARAARGPADGAARAGVRRPRRLLRLPARRVDARHRQRPARGHAQPPRRLRGAGPPGHLPRRVRLAGATAAGGQGARARRTHGRRPGPGVRPAIRRSSPTPRTRGTCTRRR